MSGWGVSEAALHVLWLSAALVPLGIAAGQALVGLAPAPGSERARRVLTWLAPLAVLPAAWLGLGGPAGSEVDMFWLLLGTSFHLDGLGRVLLVMSAALYGLALVMVARSGDERASALSGLLLLCFVANAGVFVAADVITLYLCFTVMSLVGYALVIHDRSAEARRAGRIYLFLAIAGETAVLAASMLTVHAGGLHLADAPAAVATAEHTGVIVALLWVGFGIKVGVVPLHVWLPLAHPAAPTPASAVLSGAMITGGLAGWLRMLPLGEATMTGWGMVFAITGLAGAYAAVLLGVLQAQPKAVLAYSSVSQMGLLSALVGAGLLLPEAAGAFIAAAVLYAAHHGIIKAGLFFGVGLWHSHGAGPVRWLVMAGLVAGGLSLAGWPLTSGYLAKYLAKDAAAGLELAGLDMYGLLVGVGTGSTLLVARTLWLLRGVAPGAGRLDVTLVAWLALLAGSIPLVTSATGGLWDGPLPGWWDLGTWWDQGWPVLAGLALVVLAWRVSRAEVLPEWLGHPDGRAVPPGDVVVAEERLATRIRSGVQVVVAVLGQGRAAVAQRAGRLPSPSRWFNIAEQHLAAWRASGLTLLGLVSVFLVMTGWGR